MRANVIYVVETDDGQAYLGRVVPVTLDDEVVGLKILTGYRGHPRTLDPADVLAIQPAWKHPDVVVG
jgi:hypothetical protein